MSEKLIKKALEHSQHILTVNQRHLMQCYVLFNEMFDRMPNNCWASAKFMNESQDEIL